MPVAFRADHGATPLGRFAHQPRVAEAPTLGFETQSRWDWAKLGICRRTLKNDSSANVYLLLYPKKPLAYAIKANPKLIDSLWQALKAITSEALTDEGRVYGGGLYKMEPRELGNVSADSIIPLLPNKSVGQATQVTLW